MEDWIQTSLEDCPAQPWANSFGVTQEVLAWPQRDDWVLRVSVARIAKSGPYSVLPETRRWHTVLEGSLLLSLADKKVALDPESEPFAFDGALPCECELIKGPAKAFNTMTRGPFQTSVYRACSAEPMSLCQILTGKANQAGSNVLVGLFSVAATRVTQKDNIIELDPGQWIWSDRVSPDLSRQTHLSTECALLVVLERSF